MGGDLEDVFEPGVAAVLGVAEQHAEEGDGGGELIVFGGIAPGSGAIWDGDFEELARIGVGFFVSQFDGEKIVALDEAQFLGALVFEVIERGIGAG